MRRLLFPILLVFVLLPSAGCLTEPFGHVRLRVRNLAPGHFIVKITGYGWTRVMAGDEAQFDILPRDRHLIQAYTELDDYTSFWAGTEPSDLDNLVYFTIEVGEHERRIWEKDDPGKKLFEVIGIAKDGNTQIAVPPDGAETAPSYWELEFKLTRRP